MADEPRKEPLGYAHRLKRNMHEVMPDAAHRAADLLSRECHEIDMREDKFDTGDLLIKAHARRSVETRAAPFFIPRQCKKAAEERARADDEDEIRHNGLVGRKACKAAYFDALAELLRRLV